MWVRLFMLCSLVFVGGCSWEASSSAPLRRDVMFECEGGEMITVQFWTQQERALLWRGTETLELHQVPTASGFKYVNGPTQIQGKGEHLTVRIGQRSPLECRQQ